MTFFGLESFAMVNQLPDARSKEFESASSAFAQTVAMFQSTETSLSSSPELSKKLRTVIIAAAEVIGHTHEELLVLMHKFRDENQQELDVHLLQNPAESTRSAEVSRDIDFDEVFNNLPLYVSQGGRILLRKLQEAYRLDPATWVPVQALMIEFDTWVQVARQKGYDPCINSLKRALEKQHIELEGKKVAGIITARRLKRMHIPSSSEDTASTENTAATSLDDLNLSVRARHRLDSIDVITVEGLEQHTATELLCVRNFGDTCLLEVRTALYKKKKHLKNDDNWMP